MKRTGVPVVNTTGTFFMPAPTSVPGGRFHHSGRKFHGSCTLRLQSPGADFAIWDGSFMARARSDFRPLGPISTFGTEVSCPVPVPTSVPGVRFHHLGRKIYARCLLRLPSSWARFHHLGRKYLVRYPAPKNGLVRSRIECKFPLGK